LRQTIRKVALKESQQFLDATTDSAFADKKKYEKNQAISQANVCGNGFLPENVFCQNHASQIQGDENAIVIAGTQQGDD
jgi:hypothetical protein